MIIRVYPKKVVAVNTIVEFWVSAIINPPNEIAAGITLKISSDCLGS